jgi:hypothetical protein
LVIGWDCVEGLPIHRFAPEGAAGGHGGAFPFLDSGWGRVEKSDGDGSPCVVGHASYYPAEGRRPEDAEQKLGGATWRQGVNNPAGF